jgi:hypothetical protein
MGTHLEELQAQAVSSTLKGIQNLMEEAVSTLKGIQNLMEEMKIPSLENLNEIYAKLLAIKEAQED